MSQFMSVLAGEGDFLMRLAGVAGWRLKADFSFEWSEAMYELFELSQTCSGADVIGRCHPDDRNQVTRNIAATFKTGVELFARYRILRPHGGVRHILSRAVRRWTPDGPELIGVNIDVTQHLAEFDIDFDEMRSFKFIAENARDMIIRYGLDGTITFASPATSHLLGLKASQVVGYNVLDLVAEDARVTMLERLAKLNQLGEALGPMAFPTVKSRGLSLWLEGNPRPVKDALGRLIEWVDVLRDVTERKASEAALIKAREDADAAMAAKSEFLANMSHELRTPLTSIIGFAGLIGASGLDLTDQRRLDHVKRAGQTLLSIVNDVLDLAKLDQGAMPLNPIAFDLVSFARDTLASMEATASVKGLALELDLAVDAPEAIWVLGDELRLNQVLMNLLSNAVKFTASGAITLGLRVAPVGAGSYQVAIWVEDSGIGIAPESLAKVFGRFSQADSSINRRYGGTGLGLSICQNLLNLMGGEMTVESTMGRGSRFEARLRLPAAQAATAPSQGSAPHEPAAVASARILLAEDNPANRELLKAIFSQTDMILDLVENGAEAVKAVSQAQYDLVLMDIQMPVMDGISATQAIRSLSGPAAAVPIIALSANVLPGQLASYSLDGFTAHVGKPIEPRLLFEAIYKCLSQESLGADDARTTPQT